MEARKLEFANEVAHIVCHLGEVVFHIKNDEQLINVFGVTEEQLKMVITKIVMALPDSIFDKEPRITDEIKNIFAREFIFFQVQERWGSPQYQDDLLNFIRVFTRDIQQRVDAYHMKARMKEE